MEYPTRAQTSNLGALARPNGLSERGNAQARLDEQISVWLRARGPKEQSRHDFALPRPNGPCNCVYAPAPPNGQSERDCAPAHRAIPNSRIRISYLGTLARPGGRSERGFALAREHGQSGCSCTLARPNEQYERDCAPPRPNGPAERISHSRALASIWVRSPTPRMGNLGALAHTRARWGIRTRFRVRVPNRAISVRLRALARPCARMGVRSAVPHSRERNRGELAPARPTAQSEHDSAPARPNRQSCAPKLAIRLHLCACASEQQSEHDSVPARPNGRSGCACASARRNS